MAKKLRITKAGSGDYLEQEIEPDTEERVAAMVEALAPVLAPGMTVEVVEGPLRAPPGDTLLGVPAPPS